MPVPLITATARVHSVDDNQVGAKNGVVKVAGFDPRPQKHELVHGRALFCTGGGT